MCFVHLQQSFCLFKQRSVCTEDHKNKQHPGVSYADHCKFTNLQATILRECRDGQLQSSEFAVSFQLGLGVNGGQGVDKLKPSIHMYNEELRTSCAEPKAECC